MSDVNQAVTVIEQDWACVRCSYNLRGQQLNRSESGKEWEARCSECGTAQAVEPRRNVQSVSQWLVLVSFVAGIWICWTLLTWLAIGQSVMSAGFDTRAAAQFNIVAGRRTAVVPEGTLLSFFTAIAINGVVVFLPGIAVGTLFSIAPYARGRQRDLVAGTLILGACLVGAWMGYSGYSAISSDGAYQRLVLQASSLNGRVQPEWQWQVAGSVSGLLIALLGMRLGLAVGRWFVMTLVAMFVPPDRFPTWLRPVVR